MDPVRIAAVRYLNTLPLIHGLEKLQGVELLLTVPSRIADMVRGGEADVGLVSLVDAASPEASPLRPAAEKLAILPVGMIGCDGPTLTVRLFSAVPFERVTTVHADTDSRTSVVLCRVLLARLFGVRPTVVPFDARERMPGAPSRDAGGAIDLDAAWPQTVLLIGDKVVTDPPPAARLPHQLDLGQSWRELTGLPFVYAAWACRAADAATDRVATAAAVLDRQRRRNAARLGWLADRFAPDHRWPCGLARDYLGSLLRFDPGDRERGAAGRFLDEARVCGIIPPSSLVWAPPAYSPERFESAAT